MADLKKRTNFINILLDKWIKADKLDNDTLGSKVRKWFYTNENRVEHWLIDEGNIPWDGDDNIDKSRSYDDGDDEIY